jgi:hypothetical protein
MDTTHMGRFLQALPAALSIAALIVVALPTEASAQPNIITCTLKRDGAEFKISNPSEANRHLHAIP